MKAPETDDMHLKVALAQTDAAIGDIEGNIATHLEFAARARAESAALVVFPELSLTGYTIRDLNADVAVRADNLPGAYKELLASESRDLDYRRGGRGGFCLPHFQLCFSI